MSIEYEKELDRKCLKLYYSLRDSSANAWQACWRCLNMSPARPTCPRDRKTVFLSLPFPKLFLGFFDAAPGSQSNILRVALKEREIETVNGREETIPFIEGQFIQRHRRRRTHKLTLKSQNNPRHKGRCTSLPHST